MRSPEQSEALRQLQVNAQSCASKSSDCSPQPSDCGCQGCEGPSPPVKQAPKQAPKPAPDLSIRSHQLHPVELRALYRKLRELARLELRCTFYERHEVLDAQGQVLERYSKGVPFVRHPSWGMVPPNPEDPFLEDGTYVSQQVLGYADKDGRWHRVVRYQRLPGPSGTTPWVNVKKRKPMTEAEVQESAKQLLMYGGETLAVDLLLRDRERITPMPARSQTEMAYTEHGRRDRLMPIRRKLRDQRRMKRKGWAMNLRAWLRSVGGKVQYHSTVHANVLSALVPRKALLQLMLRPEIVEVRLQPSEDPESDVDDAYLCSPTSSRYDASVDTANCENTSDRYAFLDTHNWASGVLDYVDAGYEGNVSGGNSNWGHRPRFTYLTYPTLTYGLRDPQQIDVNHPAFMRDGRSRILFTVIEDDSGLRVAGEDDLVGLVYSNDDKEHATRCAAVAMSNSYIGGDTRLSTDEDRGGRSGVARLVSGLAAGSGMLMGTMLDVIYGGVELGTDSDGTALEGVDAISSSIQEGHGFKFKNYDRCASNDDARGLDCGSLAVVYAYFNEGLVFTKSAGNKHDGSSTAPVTPGPCVVTTEVSAPGASPAALSSGALSTRGLSADGIRRASELRGDSSRYFTLDGRSYPSFAVTTDACGCASTEDPVTDLDINGYGRQTQTSGTSPRVAGAALLFKEWFLEQYGSIANAAGFILVNLLQFADGFAQDELTGTSDRQAPPHPGWGLGRFRMRLYTDSQQGKRGWGTTYKSLSTGTHTYIDITKESGRVVAGALGELPTGLRHLRITAWWLEVNTDEGESKADIRMSLIYANSSGELVGDTVTSGQEHVLRLQYDRADSQFLCPPSGPAMLHLWSEDVPTDARSVNGSDDSEEESPVRRTYRSVFVTWFWETDEDSERLSCETAIGSTVSIPCSRRTFTTPPPSPPESAAPAWTSPAARAVRSGLDRSLMETLRITTGLRPARGVSPVWRGGLR